MKACYLDVPYRRGGPLAVYCYLPPEADEKSARTGRAEPRLVIDYSADERPLGIEITAPSQTPVTVINEALEAVG